MSSVARAGRSVSVLVLILGIAGGACTRAVKPLVAPGESVVALTGAPAKRGFSDDTREAAANLARLWQRLPSGAVRYVCTAHAHCVPFSPRFLDDVAR